MSCVRKFFVSDLTFWNRSRLYRLLSHGVFCTAYFARARQQAVYHVCIVANCSLNHGVDESDSGEPGRGDRGGGAD